MGVLRKGGWPGQIQIVTDSTSCIERAYAAAHRVELIPLTFSYQGREWEDGFAGESQDIFQDKEQSFHTSQPPVERFQRVFQAALDQGREVVAVLISAGLSGTANSARLAAGMTTAPSRIHIVDSQNTAIVLKFLVERAVELAEAGRPAGEIEGELLGLADRSNVLIAVRSLDYLHNGGRLTRVQAHAGQPAAYLSHRYLRGGPGRHGRQGAAVPPFPRRGGAPHPRHRLPHRSGAYPVRGGNGNHDRVDRPPFPPATHLPGTGQPRGQRPPRALYRRGLPLGMTSRERARRALNHQAVDRPPIDLGATSVTGIAAQALAHLRVALGLPGPARVRDPMLLLGEVEEAVRQALGVDFVGVSAPGTKYGFLPEGEQPFRLADGTEALIAGNFRYTQDAAGNRYAYPQNDTSLPPARLCPPGATISIR